jgi:ketosteroid isomerase-like protein
MGMLVNVPQGHAMPISAAPGSGLAALALGRLLPLNRVRRRVPARGDAHPFPTSESAMSIPAITDIAKDLVTLCRSGKNADAIKKYYAENVVSVESASAPGMPAETKGIEAVTQKNKWWVDNHVVHAAEANGPYVGDSRFAVEFKYDVTHKPSGKRMIMREMALYTVQGGKIVHEHFFYNTGAA